MELDDLNPRDLAARLLRSALAAVEPRAAMHRAVIREGNALQVGGESLDLGSFEHVFVIGAGKAAPAMAQGALDLLGNRLNGGVITTKHGHAQAVPGIELWEAGHPVPDTHSLAGATAALDIARAASADDLIVCLLSGGASALWAAPPAGLPLRDLQQVTDGLLRAGAPIGEINAVRKHLSRVAGGQLARSAHPARLLGLVISDVVGSPLEVIASGPTVADPTTFADALEVLRARRVSVPARVLAYLQRGAAGEHAETVKPGDLALQRATTQVIAANRDALLAAVREAEELGIDARIVDDVVEGEARQVAREIVATAAREQQRQGADPRPLALFWGGETTVTVRGEGKGGRNQELALAAALELDGTRGILVVALGTDGTDGPTTAAGAIADAATVERGRAAGLDAADHLHRNDAYPFLQASGDLLVTGPTGTNVNDIILALVMPAA
jgi:glycerate 2-kinase